MSGLPTPQEGDPLEDTWHRFPDEVLGPWEVGLQWLVVNGRAECIGVEIYSTHVGFERGYRKPLENSLGIPLTTSVWRGVPIGRFIAEDRAGMSHEPDDVYVSAPPARQRTRDRAQEAAKVYRRAWVSKKWAHRPTAAVAAHFTISQSAAAKLVSKARELRYLPPTKPGVALAERRDPEVHDNN